MRQYFLAVITAILTFTQGFGKFSLVSTDPGKNSSDVSVNQPIVLQFSANINPFTSSSDFSITSNLRGKIICTFSISGNALTITPSAPFLIGEKIVVTIFTTLKSTSSIALTSAASFEFLIESKPSPHTPPNLLGTDILTSSGRITMIEAADMDRDGDLDITALYGPDVVWLENDGSETFSKHTVKAGLSFPFFIKPFDIDLDGDMDLIASAYEGIMIFENDVNRNFQEAATIQGYSITSFEIADFDSNGLFDIVYSSVEGTSGNYVSGTYVLFNQGSYVFNKVKISSTTFHQFLSVDLDNDNDWDIVHYDDTGIFYSLNNGGSFTIDTVFTDDNTAYQRVLIADMNKDGNQDIVFFKYKYSTQSLEVWLNNGSVQFTSNKIELSYIYELSTVGDYDGDGDQDIMIIDGNYTYSMLENEGSLLFTKKAVAHPLPGVYYPSNSVNADFDQDGDLDFLASPSSTIKLYKNTLFPFEEKNMGDMKSLTVGDSDWGDYDNDGDLDLVTTGGYESSGVSFVYENQNGKMIEKSFSLANLWFGSCDWGDFDNDGDLDILLTGASSMDIDDRNPKSFIYTNNNGEFTLLSTSAEQLPKIWFGEARWADLNNDGWLDIAFNGAYYAGVYQGDGQGNFFKQVDFPFSASWANLDMGDFDKDGDLDIAVSGYMGGAILGVFRNDGGWEFSTVSGNFVGRFGGNVSWSDMDNDGDLDLVASGTTRNDWGNGPPSITVYNNTGNSFEAIENTEFIYQADSEGTTVTGDYDNDGVSDVIASTSGGGSSYDPEMNLFKNIGTGDLKRVTIDLPKVASHIVNWIDIDQDHDLDLFVYPRMLVNNIEKKNTPPTPPTAIKVDSVYNNSMYFHWNSGQDSETPAAGLSYQIYVGKESGKQNVVNSNSHLNNGFRKVIESGLWKGNYAKVENLFGGNYFFGVQSIDASFEGSIFTNESQALVIGIHGNGGTCRGLDYSYVAEPSGSYQWEVSGGTIVSGQGTDSIVVNWNSLGKGYIKLSNSLGDRNTLPINIDERPNPIIKGNLTVCTGLETYTNTDALSHYATWMVSGTNSIANASAHNGTIDWLVPGQFDLVVQAYPEHKGCFAFDTLQVQVDQRPNPLTFGPESTCVNQIDTYSTESTKHQWEVINGSMIVDSLQLIRVKWPISGLGYVILSEESARAYCTAVDSLLVTINSHPAKPTLTLYQDTIILSSPSPTEYYQWYHNDELVISGPYIGVVPYVAGKFVVEVFNLQGCGSKSDPFYFLITAIQEPGVENEESNFLIYPNPTNKEITIELNNNDLGNVNLLFYSASSVLTKEIMIQKTDHLLRQEIDVSELHAGYYILIIKTDNNFYSAKLIKL